LRTVVFSEPGKVELREIARPAVRAGHLLIETQYSAISTGTELLVLEGRLPEAYGGVIRYPLVPGYENVGRVVERGADVTGVEVGDWVVCEGAANFPGLYSFWGGHSGFVLAPYSDVFRLPADLSPEHGLFTVLTSIALHALQRGAVTLGQRVAVVGQGTVGLLAVQIARAMGAAEVLAIDRFPERLEVARAVGATAALQISSPEGLGEQARDLLEPGGFDVVVEVSGSASLAAAAPSLCRERGRLVLAGMYTERVGFAYWDLFTRELDISASRQAGPRQSLPPAYYPWTWRRTHEESLSLLAAGTVNVEPIITDRLPIERIDEAYEALRSRPEATIKVVLGWQ
jgi:3-hydroxyethyl bacteriochlorophyllide a dehydrogenase